jgi:hypothetical protein
MQEELMAAAYRSSADQAVYAIASATAEDALARLRAIDAVLQDSDGLKWFNRLYMMVTQQVDQNPPGGAWRNPAWLNRLDAIFAGLYFRALSDFLTGGSIPSSWNALFAARFQPGIDRIQFALAGMNAHINHDLAQALLAVNAEMNVAPSLTSPEHADFESVNTILKNTIPAALNMIATDVLGMAAQDTGKIGRLLAFWDVCKARELAWVFADHLRGLGGISRDVALSSQDAFTGAIGRAILVMA